MEPTGFRDLVRQAQGGDAQATARLEALLRPHVERSVRRRAGPAHPDQSYHDWVQDVWRRLWQALDQFHGVDAEGDDEAWKSFRAWVRRIVRSVLANAARHRSRHEPPAPRRKLSLRAAAGDGSASGDGGLDVAARDPTPSTDLLARERVRQLSDALETLPADERELLQLHVFEKLTWDEVAARQGLTVHQVKYQYQLLLQRLRRDLDRLP